MTENEALAKEIYTLCNKKDYFTCGSTTQYNKLFDMIKEGSSVHDIALIIFICSDFSNEQITVQNIEKEIIEIKNKILN